MDYILRKFKYKQKSLSTTTAPKMVITSPTANTDSDSSKFEFEVEEQISFHSSPLKHNQLKQQTNKSQCNHNCITSDRSARHSHHSSHYSLNSSQSPSSASSDDPEHSLINTSAVKKILSGRPLVRRNCFDEEELQISDNSFAIDCLYWHNLFRAKHGSPPLTISYRLVNMAQEWANYLAHTDSYKYRNSEGVGENLMCKWTCHPEFDPPGESIVKFWYSEIELYNYSIDPSIMHTLANHFTQIVWKSTQEFGIGKAHTRGGKCIVVANYRPAGNIIGRFHQNVLPLIRDENHKKSEDIDSINETPIHSQSLISH